MSGWGAAEGRASKFVVECATMEDAFRIEEVAHTRSEMRYIRICKRAPRFRNAHVSVRKFENLGSVWTGKES